MPEDNKPPLSKAEMSLRKMCKSTDDFNRGFAQGMLTATKKVELLEGRGNMKWITKEEAVHAIKREEK